MSVRYDTCRPTPTDEFLDGHAVQHVERGVEFQGLTAPLAHEADLHGGAGRGLGALHRCGSADK